MSNNVSSRLSRGVVASALGAALLLYSFPVDGKSTAKPSKKPQASAGSPRNLEESVLKINNAWMKSYSQYAERYHSDSDAAWVNLSKYQSRNKPSYGNANRPETALDVIMDLAEIGLNLTDDNGKSTIGNSLVQYWAQNHVLSALQEINSKLYAGKFNVNNFDINKISEDAPLFIHVSSEEAKKYGISEKAQRIGDMLYAAAESAYGKREASPVQPVPVQPVDNQDLSWLKPMLENIAGDVNQIERTTNRTEQKVDRFRIDANSAFKHYDGRLDELQNILTQNSQGVQDYLKSLEAAIKSQGCDITGINTNVAAINDYLNNQLATDIQTTIRAEFTARDTKQTEARENSSHFLVGFGRSYSTGGKDGGVNFSNSSVNDGWLSYVLPKSHWGISAALALGKSNTRYDTEKGNLSPETVDADTVKKGYFETERELSGNEGSLGVAYNNGSVHLGLGPSFWVGKDRKNTTTFGEYFRGDTQISEFPDVTQSNSDKQLVRVGIQTEAGIRVLGNVWVKAGVGYMPKPGQATIGASLVYQVR